MLNSDRSKRIPNSSSESAESVELDSITFSKHPSMAGTHQLRAQQCVSRKRDEVFEFFSNPDNLERITPPSLSFRITGDPHPEMDAGTRIDYELRLHGIRLKWQSLISVWRPPCEFVDEQVRGPYRLWRHRHLFEERAGVTLVRDVVDYQVPGGWLINRLLVRPDLERIFRFRHARIGELLGNGRNAPARAAGAAETDV